MNGEDGELSPREHLEMRNELLAGVQSIRRARARRAQFVAGCIALVVVSGVAGGIAGYALNGPHPASSSAGVPSASQSRSVPPQCVEYDPSATINYAHGAQLQSAIDAARLPDGVALSLASESESMADAPRLELTFHVCGERVTRDTLVRAGNAIAMVLAATDLGPLVSGLTLGAREPNSSGVIAETPGVPSIRTDFQAYDWSVPSGDSDAAWQ